MSLRRALLLLSIAAWASAVAVLTLSPSGYTPPLTLDRFLCVGCTTLGVADIILNWMMFVPGGLLVACVFPRRVAIIAAIGFTLSIETLQIAIPGRYPALEDLIFNTFGAISGTWLVGHHFGRVARGGFAAAAAVAWLAPLVLLVPLSVDSALYGQWTPAFGSMEQYRGRVLQASVGAVEVPSGRLDSQLAVHRALAERAPIDLMVEIGPPPSSAAPLFQIGSEELVPAITIGILDRDVLLRGNNLARVLRLDQPDARWVDATASLTAGDTVMLVVERARDSICMSIDEREACQLASALGDGWAFLRNVEGAPAWFRSLVSLMWCLGLGTVWGLTRERPGTSLGAATLLAALGVVGSYASADVRPDLLHAALLLPGAGLGPRMRPLLGRLWTWLAAVRDPEEPA